MSFSSLRVTVLSTHLQFKRFFENIKGSCQQTIAQIRKQIISKLDLMKNNWHLYFYVIRIWEKGQHQRREIIIWIIQTRSFDLSITALRCKLNLLDFQNIHGQLEFNLWNKYKNKKKEWETDTEIEREREWEVTEKHKETDGQTDRDIHVHKKTLTHLTAPAWLNVFSNKVKVTY